jgi:hypothetical protein
MTVTTPVARRAQQPIQRRIEADLVVKAWSQLFVLEQSTVLILTHLMRRQSIGSRPVALLLESQAAADDRRGARNRQS